MMKHLAGGSHVMTIRLVTSSKRRNRQAMRDFLAEEGDGEKREASKRRRQYVNGWRHNVSPRAWLFRSAWKTIYTISSECFFSFSKPPRRIWRLITLLQREDELNNVIKSHQKEHPVRCYSIRRLFIIIFFLLVRTVRMEFHAILSGSRGDSRCLFELLMWADVIHPQPRSARMFKMNVDSEDYWREWEIFTIKKKGFRSIKIKQLKASSCVTWLKINLLFK